MKFPLNDHLINALCHTFVQSLWQGILLAAAAGIIIICTKKMAAAMRYTLLVSALLLFAAGVFVTFLVQFGNGQRVPASAAYTIQHGDTYVGTAQSDTSAGFAPSLSGYLNRHSDTIVLIWFFIISIKIIQLTAGLYGTYRLKRQEVFSVSGHWQESLERLSDRMGIRQHIRMLESGLSKVPVVIGSLKPVILIPLGLLNSLSYEETEVILLHELAHIRRVDFLVNLVQNLLEIIFFFNPAVLWVSELIKTERENCCDDLALRHTADKANYIRALLSCEQYRSGVGMLAMAFPGDKHSLLSRVRRLANNRNHSLNRVEKTLLAFCIILSGACLTALTKKEAVKETEKKVVRVGDLPKAHKPEPASPSQKPMPQKSNPAQKIKQPAEHASPEIVVDPWPPFAEKDTIPSVKDPVYNYQDGRPNGAYAYASLAYQQHRPQTQAERDSVLHEILTDMLKDGIIASAEDDLVFTLTGKKFIVNGNLLDDKISERYWLKYAPANNDGSWTWSHSYHDCHCKINKELPARTALYPN